MSRNKISELPARKTEHVLTSHMGGSVERSAKKKSTASEMDVARRFEAALQTSDLFKALQLLNHTTDYRFTGVYRFEPGLVKSVVLYDRQNPNIQSGEDVPWFDSYCMMTAADGEQCEIEHSLTDPRLGAHAAREKVRSYCAVLLRTPGGEELGTLCHYDTVARATKPGIFEGLRACRSSVERHLWDSLKLRRGALPAR